MELEHTKLLGKIFEHEQDHWLKIRGIKIGISPQFNYKKLETFDQSNIKNLLDECYKDKNIVAVLYNWSNGIAYIKNGIDIKNPDDSIRDSMYTSFLVKPRSSHENIPKPIECSSKENMGDKLIGVKFMKNIFEKHSRPEWVQIKGVCIGRSSRFSYKIEKNDNIEKILDKYLIDVKAVVIVYNKVTETSYIKSGFNLDIETDYGINNCCVSFIIKNKVTSSMVPRTLFKNKVIVQYQEKKEYEVLSENFVSWDNKLLEFRLENKKFIPCGFNVYWLGYTEYHNYPAHLDITEMFELAVKMKATLIRSYTLACNFGNKKSLRPSNNNLNLAFEPIDFAFSEAKRTGIKLVVPLCNAYPQYSGWIGSFTETHNLDPSFFWTDHDVRNDFKDFIEKWLNHHNKYTGYQYKNSEELLFIETGNELGNYRPRNGSTSGPTKEWTADISKFIKNIAPNVLILDGVDEALSDDNFEIKETDCVGAHFYGLDYKRLEKGATNALLNKKPYIIGEYSSNFGQDWYDKIESIPGISGDIVWCIQPSNKNGKNSECKKGFDMCYKEDLAKLLVISNHFRKIQGLPKVSNL
jgi:hypothetical protein